MYAALQLVREQDPRPWAKVGPLNRYYHPVARLFCLHAGNPRQPPTPARAERVADLAPPMTDKFGQQALPHHVLRHRVYQGRHGLAVRHLSPDREHPGQVRFQARSCQPPPVWSQGTGPTASLEPAGRRPALTRLPRRARRRPWSWLLTVVGKAAESGPGPVIDDNLAYAAPWGFDPEELGSPVLFLHGGQDRVIPVSHGEWLARRCRSAELRIRPDDGHISVLSSAFEAMAWLHEHSGQG